jgi:alkylhydroperoxidase family enzyme
VTLRIGPLGRSELDPDTVATLLGFFPRAAKYLDDRPDAPPMPPILGLLGRHTAIAGPWLGYNRALLERGELEPRERELLILATARRAGSTYLWQEHVGMAAAAGLTTDEIGAIAGTEESVLSPRDTALLGAVDELFADRTVSDGTWRALVDYYDERELIEVLFVIGTYLCLAMVLNSVGLDAESDRGKENRP